MRHTKPGRLANRIIGVDLVFHGILEQHFYKCRPYGAWVLGAMVFYTNAVPTGLKRALKYPRFVAKICRSFKQDLPFLSAEMVVFLKLTLMVRLGMQVAFGRVRRKTAPTGG